MPINPRQEVRRVFMEVAELPASEQAAALDLACKGNDELRAEVDALLAADQQADGFMAHPTELPGHAAALEYTGERPGTHIGPYKLVELIGEGGFGSVFKAEQQRPVARTVALKIIKLGMDTRQVIARFEAERQALVILEHPNIARVLDAGATELGRPYFVMELVKGEPIAEYCDKHNLSVKDRLELFAQVCSAIQHAHTKGVIHRDIKPSNILVGTLDGRASAKVIDFGIAKATASKLTEKTLFTEHRQLLGTPEYMSPEQAQGSLDIDTRTDVYSLGVLLYELLTGSTPFNTRELRSAAFEEMRRIIREVDPPKPSTRLGQEADTLANVAARRRIEPRKLGTLVRGELDWIVMKAMEKDRARRYETASAFGADINRYLTGDAVLAAPPGAAYRARKFVRRHRGAVLAGSAVAAALLVGLVAFAWQARVASRERDVARQEAARATANNNFVENMFIAADPETNGVRDMTVLELLSKVSASVDRTLAGQPLVEAYARALLGRTFRSLGKMDQARAELERALVLQKDAGETNTLYMAGTLRNLGLLHLDRAEPKMAFPFLQQAMHIIVGLGHDFDREAMRGYADLARAHLALGEFPECEQAISDAEAVVNSSNLITAGDQAYVISIRSQLAKTWKNDQALSERLAEQLVALWRKEDAPISLSDALNNLAVFRMNAGRLDEAIALYEESLKLCRDEMGESHQKIAIILENCANAHYRKKELDRAQSLLEQALKIRETVFGAGSMQVARTGLNMGSIALERRDFARSLELADSALPLFRENMGEKSAEYATVLRVRAASLKGKGDLDAALADYNTAVIILDAIASPTSVARLRCLQAMTEMHCHKGSYDEADRTAKLALQVLDANVPDQAKWITTFEAVLARCRTAAAP
ncbi:MAG: serine/threonine protein kinase [Pyrinomonadaceae bacterium]|nr:serine/threonine protein kinase [Phycisphaerales bacterium]